VTRQEIGAHQTIYDTTAARAGRTYTIGRTGSVQGLVRARAFLHPVLRTSGPSRTGLFKYFSHIFLLQR